MHLILVVAVLLGILCSAPTRSFAAQAADTSQTPPSQIPSPKPTAAQPATKCEHGVKKTICARCKPKLAAAYKAKGDWCNEHERPESQCAICNPKLEKQGIKP